MKFTASGKTRSGSLSLAASGGSEAFRWTAEGGMIGLGGLPGAGGYSQTMANGVSAGGSLVVGTSISSVGEEAFIWDKAHGMQRLQEVLTTEFALDLSGWHLTSASAISADGTVIVGTAYGPHFQEEAWRAVIPEPSTAPLVTTAAVGFAANARRLRRRAK